MLVGIFLLTLIVFLIIDIAYTNFKQNEIYKNINEIHFPSKDEVN